MKSIRTSTVLAAAFLGTLVSPAHAQETISATVPFVVRGEEFPAGRYEFTAEQGLLTMRGHDNGSGVFAMAMPARTQERRFSKPAREDEQPECHAVKRDDHARNFPELRRRRRLPGFAALDEDRVAR
jgi:hypothetical protein